MGSQEESGEYLALTAAECQGKFGTRLTRVPGAREALGLASLRRWANIARRQAGRMPRITISYRRADSDAIAGRIRDRLARHYGDRAVFMDIDNIPFGIDFREHIKGELASNDMLVAVVGPKWLGPGKRAGTFRTHQHDARAVPGHFRKPEQAGRADDPAHGVFRARRSEIQHHWER